MSRTPPARKRQAHPTPPAPIPNGDTNEHTNERLAPAWLVKPSAIPLGRGRIEVGLWPVRKYFPEVLNRVTYQGTRVVIVTKGEARAAIISLEDLARLEALDAREGARQAG